MQLSQMLCLDHQLCCKTLSWPPNVLQVPQKRALPSQRRLLIPVPGLLKQTHEQQTSETVRSLLLRPLLLDAKASKRGMLVRELSKSDVTFYIHWSRQRVDKGSIVQSSLYWLLKIAPKRPQYIQNVCHFGPKAGRLPLFTLWP